MQSWRKLTQIGALALVVLIPVIESYRRLLTYIPVEYIGSFWRYAGEYADATFITGGYLSQLVIGVDAVFGNMFRSARIMVGLTGLFNSYYWSATIGGLTFFDPLSILQFIRYYHPLTLTFALAVLIPLALAAVCGPVYCSWVCPVNTLMEFSRFLQRKLKGRPLMSNLIVDQHWRYLLLALGIVLTGFGFVVFPYILPYTVLGRFFFYLTLGIVSWYGLIFIGAIIAIDLVIQRGFWCNYLCPTGATLGLLGKKRLLKIRRDPDICLEKCSACQRVCAWQANPKLEDIHSCTNCHACVGKCPTKALLIELKVKD